MKKNDVFTFTAPNGVEVTAVVLDITHVGHTEGEKKMHVHYLCYAQNRLFKGSSWYGEKDGETKEWNFTQETIIVDYAILPDYDELIQLHSSMEYPQWEQNLEAEIQGMNDR